MKKWIKKIVLPIGIVGLAIGLSACGQTSEEEKHAKAVKKVSYFLDLEDAQKPQAEALISSVLEIKTELKANRLDEVAQLKAAVQRETLDETMLNNMIDHKINTLNKHKAEVVTQLSALHATLNEEQKAKLVAALSKIEKRMNHK